MSGWTEPYVINNQLRFRGLLMTAEPQHYDEVLPNPGFEITPGSTAVVITDPQVDFLSEDGVTWGIVGPSVEKNGTVSNL